MQSMKHLDYLQQVADSDVALLREKEKTYKGSWQKNGGSHAWQMIKRKIDRLMNMLSPLSEEEISRLLTLAEGIDNSLMSNKAFSVLAKDTAVLLRRAAQGDDIFAALAKDSSGADGTVLAEIRDLRCYLLLVESRMLAEKDRLKNAKGTEKPVPLTDLTPKTDSNKHADTTRTLHNYKNIAFRQVDGTWKVVPVVSKWDLEDAPKSIKERYILTGEYAVVDRGQYTDEERDRVFPIRYSQTIVRDAYNKLSAQEKELYEAREGVEDEWQLRILFRKHWGR